MTIRTVCLSSVCGLAVWAVGCSSDLPTEKTATSAARISVEEEEHIVEPEAAIALGWDVRDDGTVLETRGSALDLTVRNTTAEPLQVALVASADDGAIGLQRSSLGSFQLAGGETRTTTVDARRFGFDLAGLRFSGRVHVTAKVSSADGRAEEPSISSPVFFHQGANGLTFYGKKALRETFRSGDFRGTAREIASDGEPETLLRVTDVGSGNGSATALRDEQAALAKDVQPDAIVPAVLDPASSLLNGTLGLATYRTCVQFRSQTLDSGIPIANGPNIGGLEDYRANWNDGLDVPAYGVRVKLKLGDWEQTFDTEPSTGCFNWLHVGQGPYLMTVYAYATNAMNTFARVHNAPDDFSPYPGKTYRLTTYYKPVLGQTTNVAVGSYDSEWTTMATLAFSLLRLNIGSGNKEFHVAMDNVEKSWSSAHWGESNQFITEGRHYVKIDNYDAESSKLQSQRKFLVGHELGHAFAALFYGSHPDAVNGWEPGGSDLHSVTPSDDSCGMGESYSIRTKEWNSLGFREGFAHFVSAIVWNNHHREGSFHWLGSHHDLERYSDGVGTNSGGRLENVCCVGANPCVESWKNATTIEDWMLFFWDWYTNDETRCSVHPTRTDMMRLYRDTRLQPGLNDTNYFSAMQTAVQGMNVAPCLKGWAFDFHASWNGIHH
jgi:hypothetical protein